MPENCQESVVADRACIAVSATFTAEAIEPSLTFWIKELGLPYDLRFAPYSQVFQQLLDPASQLARNRSGVNVVLIRFEDWTRADPDLPRHIDRLSGALSSFSTTAAVPLIVAICPATPEHAAEAARAEETLRHAVSSLTGVHLITPGELLDLYPVAECHDPHADELGHVPYTPVFFAALGAMVMRKVHAIRQPPRKVIALDCDDTLWRGICGEDGPHGVILDPPRRGLHEFMAAQREAGMLLALCSKNNEEDVAETFRAHPEMPLRPELFVAQRINWGSKGINLMSLADELQLGIDTFILVDDNPKECNEAQAACPGALALALPPNAEEIPIFLKHVWAFDHAHVTEEDRRRSHLYAEQAERARVQSSSASLEEFLHSLQLEIRIGPVEPAQIPRVAQLTQRTNQMNLTCVRRTESEIARMPASQCLAIEVSDRFGSYGLTGVVIYRPEKATLVVDTFLLSCRVLGRGVEHRVLARLGETALEHGLARIDLPYIAMQRNRPALLFLESIAQRDTDGVFRLSSQAAAAVRYHAAAIPAAHSENVASGPSSVSAPPVAGIDYARIARDLRDPYVILDRINESRQATLSATAPVRTGGTLPRTPLERDIAELWGSLLGLAPPGVHDNFFDLGGHSLLAVQLLSRVRQIYNVDLSLDVVYSGEFTVAELSKAIELKEIEASGGEYEDLLKELEGLTDDEVRALLDAENGSAS